ncbi:hypothetical protein GOL75_14080 [Sinorhizobium medicae]|nr:hypothetical protein [Sinorhizobium medicae]MDX1162447.1 hypothetical protein [Sinorhizobium medicae]
MDVPIRLGRERLVLGIDLKHDSLHRPIVAAYHDMHTGAIAAMTGPSRFTVPQPQSAIPGFILGSLPVRKR